MRDHIGEEYKSHRIQGEAIGEEFFSIVGSEVLLIRVEDLFSLEIFYSSTCNLSVGTHISFPFSVFCIFHP